MGVVWLDSNLIRCVSRKGFGGIGEIDREGNGDAGLATFRGWENHDRKSFDVAIDGLRRNSELSEHTWTKYFELCRSQNAFLHENLLKRHHKLVVGIIAETLVLANGIKASKISTFADDFVTWDQSLEGFGHLGMNVGFLRAKLNRLQKLVPISEEELYLKRSKEAEVEHAHMEEEIKRLELEILKLKEASKMLDVEAYLTKQDVTITLIDEDKKEFRVKFGSEGVRFSFGWNDIFIAHKLVEGYVMVFQLTKVFIIRAYNSTGVDKGFGLEF
ncbi:hypothetical protein GIB67_014234 [Kingdonia uniflora]|uniref:Uncharacterized protein n=1 Tax=Kingdonia uniflora TaxID=39325 RepID=A0A7J7M1X0_9MAGN|nr:hypothetical protein GIB67_014234 [Kingdonia uniflora]